MTTQPRRRPLVPEDRYGPTRRPADALIRYAAAQLLARVERRDVMDVVRERWPLDDALPALTRAATAPATTVTSGWADSLAATSVQDFFISMGPASAGAALLSRGLQFEFGATANIAIPGILAASGNSSFVEQGAPIPVRELSATSTALLSPRKFATICSFTEEMANASQIESVVGTVLRESVGLSLDAALLDASAGSAIRPAGLRNGIGATTESANTNLFEAMLEDLDAIIAVVSAVANNNPIIIVADPARARRMMMRFASAADIGFEIMSSSALGAAEVVAVATNGLVSAVDPAPRISIGNQGGLVMDTAPAAVVSGGGTPAPSTRSLWQTNSVGLRLIFECNWGLRSTSALAWVEDVIW